MGLGSTRKINVRYIGDGNQYYHEKVTTTQVAVNIMKFFSSIAGDSQVPQQMVKWFRSRI